MNEDTMRKRLLELIRSDQVSYRYEKDADGRTRRIFMFVRHTGGDSVTEVPVTSAEDLESLHGMWQLLGDAGVQAWALEKLAGVAADGAARIEKWHTNCHSNS